LGGGYPLPNPLGASIFAPAALGYSAPRSSSALDLGLSPVCKSWIRHWTGVRRGEIERLSDEPMR